MREGSEEKERMVCGSKEEDLREQRGGYEGREKDPREREDMRIR